MVEFRTIRSPVTSVLACLLVFASAPLLTGQPGPAEQATRPTRGFRADYLMELDRFQDRVTALVQEIPEERLSWSSSVDSRSLGEQIERLISISLATIDSLERSRSTQPPEPRDKSRSKPELLKDLEQMGQRTHAAVLETPDGELELPIDHLGRRWSVRSIFLLLHAQQLEALGHLAASAECAGVLAPWTQQRRAEEASDD